MWTPEKSSKRRYTSRSEAMRESVKVFIAKFFDDFGGVEVPDADLEEQATTILGFLRRHGRYLLREEDREDPTPPPSLDRNY